MQQSCDSCLSTSDGCEWCAKTAQCAISPGPGAVSECVGPAKQGLCPTYGDCRMCEYTPSELAWLAAHGDESLGRSIYGAMPEPTSSQDPTTTCDETKGETWCALKRACVQDWVGGENGPCKVMDAPEVTHSPNGFIGS